MVKKPVKNVKLAKNAKPAKKATPAAVKPVVPAVGSAAIKPVVSAESAQPEQKPEVTKPEVKQPDLNKDNVKQAIAQGKALIKEGKSKADAHAPFTPPSRLKEKRSSLRRSLKARL